MYKTPLSPRQVRLELTNRCNARCLTCHRNTMTRALGDMDMGLVDKCISEIKRFPRPLEELVSSNYGETFLYPDWLSVLRKVESDLPNTRIVLPTNGTFLLSEVDNLISVRTLSLINVSVNAFSSDLYKAFHGYSYELMGSIPDAIDLIRQNRPDITIWISMAMDPSYQSPKEVDLFQSFWSHYGTVQINPAQYNNRPDRAPVIPVKYPCRSLYSDLVVLWNGQVSSCCFDADANPDLYVGDATELDLISIWNSSRFNYLRELHSSGHRHEIPICRRCTFS